MKSTPFCQHRYLIQIRQEWLNSPPVLCGVDLRELGGTLHPSLAPFPPLHNFFLGPLSAV